MSTRTLIRGGVVITAAEETHGDVLIEDGRIAALAAHGTRAAWGGTTTITPPSLLPLFTFRVR